MIEPKVGEVIEVHGKHYRCVEWKPYNDVTRCDACKLPAEACLDYFCMTSMRDDDTVVIFEEVEDAKES